METTTGTSLEVLAPYLPYGIEVQHLEWGARRVLTGLVAGQHAEGTAQVKGADETRLGYLLPVLRPFSALVTPLPDGTVPLYEYARFMWPREADMRHRAYGDFIEVHGSTALYLMKRSNFEAGSLHRLGAIYLQKLHFAVGLEPHQYIPKP